LAALERDRPLYRNLETDQEGFAKPIRHVLIVPMSEPSFRGVVMIGYRQVPPQPVTQAARMLGVLITHTGLVLHQFDRREKPLEDAYQQLQDFSRLKDEILQNISHELRTPLTLIKGHVELVIEDSSGRLTPAQRRGLEVAMLKVDEVVHIVEKIVSLSPMSSFALERTSIPVGSLLESMTRLMTRRVRGRPIEIHVSCPKPDLCIYGDYDKIKQVCYNILDNSIKFSPHGGDILVSASSQEGYVHLEFRDHGVGIPKKRLSRIFDTFYQVDGSSTRRFGGLGLGLTVVHRIVEAHDGKIWADSEVDRGTVFHILLPRCAEDSRVRQRLVSR
jgi:signal transduction histidine kinase